MEIPHTFACVIPWSGKNDFLDEALESVFSQTRCFDEVIVVCDQKKLPETATDKRVQWIITGGGVGAGEARNRGVEQSKADWITFLDHDDLLKAEYLSIIQESITPEVQYLQVQLRYYSEGRTGNLISSSGWHDVPTGACVRREAIKEVGGFPPMQQGEDIIFFRRLRKRFGKPIQIGKTLGLYRIHANSSSSSGALRAYFSVKICNEIEDGKSALLWEEGMKAADRMTAGVGIDPKEYRRAINETDARVYLRTSYAYWLSGQPWHALPLLMKAFISSPNFFISKIIKKWT